MLEDLLRAFLQPVGDILNLLFRHQRHHLGGPLPAYTPPQKTGLYPAKHLIKRRHHGFCLDGRRSLRTEDSFRNALVIGGTGTGKTATTIIPSTFRLVRSGASLVIHDPAGEVLRACGAELTRRGYRIARLRYDDAGHSDRYNPLLRIRDAHSLGMIAHTLIDTGLGRHTDRFWNNQGESLLGMLIGLLTRLPQRLRNMANLLHLLDQLSADGNKLDKLVTDTCPPKLRQAFAAFRGQTEKIVGGAIATAKASIKIFENETIARITAGDDLDLHRLRERPTAIFIQNPIMTLDYFAPLTSLFFRELFEILLAKVPEPKARPVFCLIDEAASFKVAWPLYLAQVRKYRVGVLLALQSFEQLKAKYSPFEARTIAANTFAKLWFTGQPHESAAALSEMMGRYEHEEGKGELLMRPREIRMMPGNRALLFCGNHPPMLARLRPWYRSRLRRRSGPPPARPRRPAQQPSLLSFDHA